MKKNKVTKMKDWIDPIVKKLPQTGTKQNSLLILLGVELITLVALVSRKKFKKQSEELLNKPIAR